MPRKNILENTPWVVKNSFLDKNGASEQCARACEIDPISSTKRGLAESSPTVGSRVQTKQKQQVAGGRSGCAE